MAEECTHDCSNCSSDCASRQQNAGSLKVPANELSEIKHVIGVVSGKGGVGKSLVTAMLAVLLNREGYRVGILDADITGPSIPKAFGMKKGEIYGDQNGMIPASSKTGIDMISVNLLLGDETKPVVWRGSLIASTVQQFWQETIWKADVLLVDCPPGTGDVPLTVFQSMPVDGVVIVSSPQDLVSMIVSKAANMAKMMNIPVLGLVENLSYVKCPDCGKEIRVFGDSHIDEIAKSFGFDLLARIPMDPKLSALVDRGMIELMENDYLDAAVQQIIAKLKLDPPTD